VKDGMREVVPWHTAPENWIPRANSDLQRARLQYAYDVGFCNGVAVGFLLMQLIILGAVALGFILYAENLP
jgi:hypothetical protein